MIIEKEYTINDSLQLIDLNQDYINFEATFDVKASKQDDKFIMSVVEEDQLEDESSINFNAVIGHINGEISNNNDSYKNFYIALKAKNEVKVVVKIDITNNNVSDNNDLNTNRFNENSEKMAEEPQRTNLNEIFDEQTPQDFQPEMGEDMRGEMQQPPQQPRKRRRKKKQVEPEPEMEMPEMEMPEMEMPEYHPEPELEPQSETILDNIIKYKYIIFGVCIVLLGYYYITYVDPSLHEKLFGALNSVKTRSRPASPAAPIMKTPIDSFTEKLASLQV